MDTAERVASRFLVWGMAVSGLIAITIIGAVVVISVATLFTNGAAPSVDESIPSVLSNWGGIILGFYFGTLFGLLKDWMHQQQISSLEAHHLAQIAELEMQIAKLQEIAKKD